MKVTIKAGHLSAIFFIDKILQNHPGKELQGRRKFFAGEAKGKSKGVENSGRTQGKTSVEARVS